MRREASFLATVFAFLGSCPLCRRGSENCHLRQAKLAGISRREVCSGYEQPFPRLHASDVGRGSRSLTRRPTLIFTSLVIGPVDRVRGTALPLRPKTEAFLRHREAFSLSPVAYLAGLRYASTPYLRITRAPLPRSLPFPAPVARERRANRIGSCPRVLSIRTPPSPSIEISAGNAQRAAHLLGTATDAGSVYSILVGA